MLQVQYRAFIIMAEEAEVSLSNIYIPVCSDYGI